LLLLGLLPAALPDEAHARDFGLSWYDCQDHGPSVPNLNFACNLNYDPPIQLTLWMSPFTEMPNVTVISTAIYLNAMDTVVPSWWQLAPGGCRAGLASVDLVTPPGPGCLDPWAGQATATLVVYSATCGPGIEGFRVTVQLPPGQSRALHMYQRYRLFRLAIPLDHTTGTDACQGCASSVCFDVPYISIGNSDGLGWSTSGDQFASWQGADCRNAYSECPITSARTTTWGSIKTLYH